VSRGQLSAALAVVLCLAGTAVAAARAPSGHGAAPVELLPDLREQAPRQLGITTWERETGNRFFLYFASQVDNVGTGPLVLEGQRRAGQEAMRVRQLVRRSDGSWKSYPMPGAAIRYRGETGHHHWHLQPFNRYRLYDPAGKEVVADQKVGFCLGDRNLLGDRSYPGTPVKPVFTGLCGRNQPNLLKLRQGLSVGYGDDYPPTVDFQFVEVTNLPAGRYRLVFTVNGHGLIHERSHADDVSALELTLTWPNGTGHEPQVRPQDRCAPPRDCATP
jgi:hypothetical protein